MRSDMAYRPAMGFLAHSMVHSVFIFARSCRWSFAMVVVSVAGSSSVASFANSSALSFHSISMCPGTYETSMLALWFSPRNDIAASTNSCDICWLGPGFPSVIASTEDVLSANSTIVDRLLSDSGISLLPPVLSVALASQRRIPRQIYPSLRSLFSSLFLSSILPIPLPFGFPVLSLSLIRRCT